MPLVQPRHRTVHFSPPKHWTWVPQACRPSHGNYCAGSSHGRGKCRSPEPSPAPRPKFIYSDRDDFRWQLGLGVSFERFRSSIYSASAVGTTTSLAYFLSDCLGIEGDLNTFFAPTIWQNEHIKLVNYGVGPKFAWRRPRWEPWFHGLFGGTHAFPQTAGHSQNGFAVQLGGGRTIACCHASQPERE